MSAQRKRKASTPTAEIPEDVRSELAMQDPAPLTATPVEPVPDDVLAEQDAEARAAQREGVVEPDLRPVELEDESEY
jgi:hypothetical protein